MDKRPWYVNIKRERLKRSWSQEDFASEIGSTAKTVIRWENGQTQLPGPYLRRNIAQVFETTPEALGLYVEEPELLMDTTEHVGQKLARPIYWGEAPTVEHFLGREQELATLHRWIEQEHCRLITILGLGGIGKTSLCCTLAQQVHDTSHHKVYWHSLQQVPTVEQFLTSCLQFILQNSPADLPTEREKQIALLLASLKAQPCLLILDNFETVFSSGQKGRKYRPGYEDYGRLLQLIGETKHASCLLVTSREKPGEIARLESKYTTTRSLPLDGLDATAIPALFQMLAISGNAGAQNHLAHLYSGNPLALKLVAEPIRSLFGGNIASFLQEKEIVFGEITALLDEQFEPLSLAEREIMYWLAVERETIALNELRAKMIDVDRRGRVLETVQALQRRSFIETRADGRFTLQPVIMEYTTRLFVQAVVEEVLSEDVALCESHAFMQAEARDYVRRNQEQAILQALANRLKAHPGKKEVAKKLQRILAARDTSQPEAAGYTAGNILNLLLALQVDLSTFDFSTQTVRQAYLQGANLPGVRFAHASLATSVFTDTFSSILCVALSSNGKILAAGTTTGEVRIWKADTLTPLLTCIGHADDIRSIALSPDHHLLVSGSEDYTVRVWNTTTGECLHVLRGHTAPIYAAAFSPDGWTIASGSEDKTVRTWDAVTGKNLALLQGHTARVRSLAFCIDGNILASGGEDRVVRLWNMDRGEISAVLEGHEDIVRALAYNPQTNVLASAGNDTTIRLWDTTTQQCTSTLRGHTDLIRALTFSADGKVLASSSDDQSISFWDMETSSLLKVLHPQSNRIWSLAFFPQGTILVSAQESAFEDDLLCYWDIQQGQCIRKIHSYCSLLKSVAFSPDGQTLFSGSEENDLRAWDVASGTCLQALRKHTNRIRVVACSTDGRMVATGSEDETICLWDISSWSLRQVLRGHTHLVRSVAFHPTEPILVSGSHDQTIRLWETETGQCLKVLQGPDSFVWCVAFSPDGKTIASSHDDQMVYLWETATGNLRGKLEGHTHKVLSVAFNPAGRTLVSASDDATLRVWDGDAGNCLMVLEGHDLWARSVTYSPDGTRIASGSHDHTIRLWDSQSGQCLKTLRGHSSCVWSVAFSPDGHTLASCGDDGTIRLWSIATGACLNVLRGERPYEQMDISHARGLTDAQKTALLILGAVER